MFRAFFYAKSPYLLLLECSTWRTIFVYLREARMSHPGRMTLSSMEEKQRARDSTYALLPKPFWKTAFSIAALISSPCFISSINHPGQQVCLHRVAPNLTFLILGYVG